MNFVLSRDLYNGIYGNKKNCFDVLIVGGGIVGCSIISLISKYDKNVCLIEKSGIGSGATMLSAGTIWSVYNNSRYDNLSLWKPIFTRETINIINNLELNNYSTGWKNCGSISFVSPENKDFLLEEFERQKNNLFNVELVDRNRIIKINPYLRYNIGIFSPLSGYVNPQKFIYALKDNACNNNVIVKEDEKVILIKKIPWYNLLNIYNYEIRTNKDNIYYSKDVILASGVDKINVEGIDLDLYNKTIPVKGHIFTSDKVLMKNDCVMFCLDSLKYWKVNNTLDVENNIPLYCTHDYKNNKLVDHFYSRTQIDGRLLFGFSRIKTTDNDYNLDENNEVEINNFIKKTFPDISNNFSKENSWTGLMPFSLYGKPIIDNLSKIGHPNLWICNGFGPSGIMCGPGAMKYFVEWLVTSNKPEILNQFSFKNV